MSSYHVDKPEAQNWVKFDFEVKLDFQGQGQSPSKTIGTLTNGFCAFSPNLVILTWNGSQVIMQTTFWSIDTQMDGHTEAGDDNTQKPKLALHQNYLKRKEYP